MFFTQGERLRQIFSSKNLNRHAVRMFALPHGPPIGHVRIAPMSGARGKGKAKRNPLVLQAECFSKG